MQINWKAAGEKAQYMIETVLLASYKYLGVGITQRSTPTSSQSSTVPQFSKEFMRNRQIHVEGIDEPLTQEQIDMIEELVRESEKAPNLKASDFNNG